MAEPVEVFIGWTAIGFGVILVFSAFRNKQPFTDLILPALKTGKIPSVGKKTVAPDGQTLGPTSNNPVVPN